MNRMWLWVMVLIACPVGATKFPHRSLESLVHEAEVIVRVTIEAVTMSNQLGEPITDPNAMTGPGRGHTITLHGRVLVDGVLKNSVEPTAAEITTVLAVRLNPKWHHRLGDMVDEVLGQEAIWLLNDKDLQPVYPGLFNRQVNELSDIRSLLSEAP
jgi:hypothetical protein